MQNLMKAIKFAKVRQVFCPVHIQTRTENSSNRLPIQAGFLYCPLA